MLKLRIALVFLLSFLLVGSSPVTLYDKLKSSVFQIFSVTKEDEAEGSGFVVRLKGKLYLITAKHVVEDSTKTTITVNSKEEKLKFKMDPKFDIAISELKFNVPALELGDDPEITQQVFAVGYPLFFSNFYSEGVISGICKLGDDDVLVSNTLIMPGSSGCPLFNKDGEVVGMAVSVLKENRSVSFYIPVSTIKSELSKLTK